ncbi:hypothetical protein PRK78_000392 [Emydomyces testavorans]|uniref:HMA domain-containing protein n=1 Tax=Emydomyces testavorans TaxID=2070801 RepID=A0AAF0DBD9_9EURO|nr:hypothetical protein PRK78_000392 [Emydomyces testavorans]
MIMAKNIVELLPNPFSHSLAVSAVNSRAQALTTTLLVNNIHCASCVAYAKEVLYHLPHITHVEISILKHEVRVSHSPNLSVSELVNALTDAAFEVFHATIQDRSGTRIQSIDIDPASWNTVSWIGPASRIAGSTVDTRVREWKKRHIANCDACKREEQKPGLSDKAAEQDKKVRNPHLLISSDEFRSLYLTSQDSSLAESSLLSSRETYTPDFPREHAQNDDEYSALVSISGMTCASCVNTVTAHLYELDFVKSVHVNLLTHTAALTFGGPKANIDKVIEQIEDIGYGASAEDPVVKSRHGDLYLADLSISGMTCGSCVAAITRSLNTLSFVNRVVINLLGHSGRIEFEGEANLQEILESIDDLGYEAAVVDCRPLVCSKDADNGPKARTIQIKVDGMFCHHCPQTVLNALMDISEGKIEVEEKLTPQKPIVTVTYVPDPPRMTIRNIIAAIEASNEAFEASIHHPPSIEDRSRAMQKQEQYRLLLRLLFTFIVAIPTFLIGIVWMAIVPKSNAIRKYFEEPMWTGSASRLEWALFFIATPVMVFGTDVFHIRAFKEIRALWRPSSRVPILRRFYRFGSMNMLISAGTSVAYFASLALLIVNAQNKNHEMGQTATYFDTVVFLTLFILAGRAVEAYSKAKTGDAVAMLGKLRPSEALLVVESPSVSEGNGAGSSIQRVPVDLLEINDTVSVPHGASPPADGLVIGPDTYQFDESSLTGESIPVRKVAGDKVYSGSVNVGQPVSMRITDLGSTSMLDQIVAVVREGQTKVAPVERVADAMTGYFVPIITLIAVLTFVIWVSLGESGRLPADYLDTSQGGWAFWALQFAIAVFVVACPCGLALAAPTALFVGGGLAAKRGILVRGGGEAFQEASRLDAVVFDKTGTLTEGGTLKVSDHEVLIKNEELVEVAWAIAQALEESSTHPIARAIVEFCNDRSSVSVTSSAITEIGGQGMKGLFTVSAKRFEGVTVEYEAVIGNQRLLESLARTDSDTYFLDNLLSKYQSAGRSTAILSIRKAADTEKFIPAIVFATSDPIRTEAAHVISQLRANHIDVYMCTGDNTITAHAVASTLGIPSTNVMSNVPPTQKAKYIRKIQEQALPTPSATPTRTTNKRPIIAFVGDGTNDSPALAAADVSIAMATGSDVAVNSAGFILLNSDLRTILDLCTLSRRVFRRVKWNFLWAAVYNVCLIPVAAGVFYPVVSGHATDSHGVVVNTHWRLDPVWAALAMALSSVSVVMSSLALRLEWRGMKDWVGRMLKEVGGMEM